jgi:hypothetical protein
MNAGEIKMTLNALLVTAGSASLALAVPCASANAAETFHVVVESGNPGTTLAKGYTTLETATMQCERLGGCMISMRIMSAISEATCKGQWAIVGLVDGNSVDGGPYQEGLPPSGETHTGTWQGAIQVKDGTHTVAFQLNVPCPATADQWSVRYMTVP